MSFLIGFVMISAELDVSGANLSVSADDVNGSIALRCFVEDNCFRGRFLTVRFASDSPHARGGFEEVVLEVVRKKPDGE